MKQTLSIPGRYSLFVVLAVFFLFSAAQAFGGGNAQSVNEQPALVAGDSNWWNGFGPQGMNDVVYALSGYGTTLAAGGNFAVAGGVPADQAATWDGVSWTALGGGFDGRVYAVSAYGTGLAAGGAFLMADGNPASYVAVWNGTSWNALGSGMNADVFALTVYNGDLIAAGRFTTAGGVPAKYIARWNGTTWSALGTGLNNYVYALAVYNGKLIAGGRFSTAGGSPASCIASWNGTSWNPVGTGVGSYVYALVNHGADLVAGGAFTSAGGNLANYLARWNGTAWSACGSGTNAPVYALASYDGCLIAGGGFTRAGGNPANFIAGWNSAGWFALGSGTNGGVFAFGQYAGSLYAGGTFTFAGLKPSYYIARWLGEPPTPIEFSFLSAERIGQAAILRWKVASGTNHPAFHVFREEPGMARQQLTAAPLSGLPEYEFIDRTAPVDAAAYWLLELNGEGLEVWHGPLAVPRASSAGVSFNLAQNRPNPFSNQTEFVYSLSEFARALLTVHDARGNLVATLVNKVDSPGLHLLVWDGRNDRGSRLANGVYFARLEFGGKALTRKVVIAR